MYGAIEQREDAVHENGRGNDQKRVPVVRWYSPFKHRDYVLLFLTNVAEFLGSSMAELSTTLFLFEVTGSSLALGLLGVVTFLVQIVIIPLGGVLADELDRKVLVSCAQFCAMLTCLVLTILSLTGTMYAMHIYIATAALQICSRLEESARGALTAEVVPENCVSSAVSLNVISSNMGEIGSPFLFALLIGYRSTGKVSADPAVGQTIARSYETSLGVATVAYFVAAVLPRLIRTNTDPTKDLPEGGDQSGLGQARSRFAALVQGFNYIISHPLLPGLYSLDWGMTCVSFYRELLPVFASTLFLHGRPKGLDNRRAVAMLTSINYLGGVIGGFVTFGMTGFHRRGRLVVIATICYGLSCLLFGATYLFPLGALAVLLCGMFDSVGAATRNAVVMLSTPDHLRGRARSGHSLAANVANSIGQVYVGYMAGAVGSGQTMILGGFLTIFFAHLAVYKYPGLLTYSDLQYLHSEEETPLSGEKDVESDPKESNSKE